MLRWAAILIVMVSACGGQSSRADRWNGYLYADVSASTGMTIAGPFASLAECRGAALARIAKMGPRAGYACGRGCPAPRDGAVADCTHVAR